MVNPRSKIIKETETNNIGSRTTNTKTGKDDNFNGKNNNEKS